MTREEKIKRGEEIIKQLEVDVNDYKDEEKRLYAAEVLHSFSPFTFDVPLEREEVAIALAEAEEQGKRIEFVPITEETQSDIPPRPMPCDGWRYKIVMV